MQILLCFNGIYHQIEKSALDYSKRGGLLIYSYEAPDF